MSGKKHKSTLKSRRAREPWFYVGPVLIILLIMFGYPLIKSVIMALEMPISTLTILKTLKSCSATEIFHCC